jgi:hypothetical protein
LREEIVINLQGGGKGLMKKQLILIGILALLVSIELSGCSGVRLTSIKDIKEHPNRYINQTVVVKGKYISLNVTDAVIDGNWNINLLFPTNITKPVPYAKYKGDYIFTGIVRYGEYWQDKEEVLFLDVTKIETT